MLVIGEVALRVPIVDAYELWKVKYLGCVDMGIDMIETLCLSETMRSVVKYMRWVLINIKILPN